MDSHGDWKVMVRAVRSDGRLERYTVRFFRRSGAWYDEMRFDSHDRIKGKDTLAPHFHMKLRSTFKGDLQRAIDGIQSIIDLHLARLQEVIDE